MRAARTFTCQESAADNHARPTLTLVFIAAEGRRLRLGIFAARKGAHQRDKLLSDYRPRAGRLSIANLQR
jgi:hypothetical protein